MFYDFEVTVPANTLRSSPQVTELPVDAGVVQRVAFLVPSGNHGMVHFRLHYQEHQYLPTNPDGFFATDDEALSFDEWFEITGDPLSFKFVADSEGCTYPHTIHVRIGILRPDEMQQKNPLLSGISKMLKLIGIGG